MSEVEMNYDNYMKLINDPTYTRLYDYYSSETAMGILGVDRNERAHSSFISWLLDISEDHGTGSAPIRKFLETICLFRDVVYKPDTINEDNLFWTNEYNILNSSNKQLVEELKYGRYEIINQGIVKERVLNKQKRADICIVLEVRFQRDIVDRSGKKISEIYLVVLIENKVYSLENDEQTLKYAESLNDNNVLNKTLMEVGEGWIQEDKISNEDIYKLFVYLNAHSTAEIEESVLKKDKKGKTIAASYEFITLNYQYLLDYVIEPINDLVKNDFSKQRLSEYIRCLGQARISYKENQSDQKVKKQEYLLMAISKKEREMALKLWFNYKNEIISILKSNNRQDPVFLLNKKDIEFWASLSILYRLINKEELIKNSNNVDEEKSVNDLKEIVESTNAYQKHRFTYKGNVYESYRRAPNSIGYLFRTIIEDLVVEKECSDKLQLMKDIRDALKKDFRSKYNYGIIMLDNEVEALNCESIENEDYGIRNIDEFRYFFFSDNPISIGDNNAYVCRFWNADDVEKLIKKIKHSFSFTINVEHEYL